MLLLEQRILGVQIDHLLLILVEDVVVITVVLAAVLAHVVGLYVLLICCCCAVVAELFLLYVDPKQPFKAVSPREGLPV